MSQEATIHRRRKAQRHAQPYELRRLDYLRRTGRHEEEAEELRARIKQLRALGAIPKEPGTWK